MLTFLPMAREGLKCVSSVLARKNLEPVAVCLSLRRSSHTCVCKPNPPSLAPLTPPVLVKFYPAPNKQLLKDRIFNPLGMNDSGYTHGEAIIFHRAAGYERSRNDLKNARFYDMSIPFAAGALYSTVGDLFLWDQALYLGP